MSRIVPPQPLQGGVAIVNPRTGQPTPLFMRLFNAIFDNTGLLSIRVTNAAAAAADAAAAASTATTSGYFIPLVTGAEPPAFVTNGGGTLILIAGG